MRAFVGVLLVLVALAAGAAGVLWLWPSGGGVQLVYSVRFPPGFSGDRGAAARETAEVLQKRFALFQLSSGATPYPDGRVLLRVANVDEALVGGLRSMLEKRGDFEIRLAKKPVQIVNAHLMATTLGAHYVLTVNLPAGSPARIDSQSDVELVLDGRVIARPPMDPSAPVAFQVSMSPLEARDWAAALQSGPLPYAVGVPQVDTYRGRSLRP